MKNTIRLVLTALILVLSNECYAQDSIEKKAIDTNLIKWHQAASDANFDTYFGFMASDGVFIGTDATENWQNKAFKAFSKPYFDKGKAWNFKALERNIYVDEDSEFAWFDELLDTQMKICRGSGVLQKIEGEWKIKHYVLSMTVPNENVKEVVEIKKEIEDRLIKNATN